MTDRQPHNLVFYKLENSPGWLPADLFGDIDSAKRICEKYKKITAETDWFLRLKVQTVVLFGAC
jgi:hypothetical protein